MARLVEVEGYLGDGTDPGSHSHRGLTRRNRAMFGPAGSLYVYRIYGIHTCANVVCEGRRGAAVLLRAAEPVAGLEYMRVHLGFSAKSSTRRLLAGPARLCRAFGISIGDDGRSLLAGPVVLHAARPHDRTLAVGVSARVGLSRGADLPYRFFARGNPFVSRPDGRRRVGSERLLDLIRRKEPAAPIR